MLRPFSPLCSHALTVVTGRRKDGGAVSLTLSVSPCGKCGEYIGILYRRTEVEAREQAESERSDFRR
eukprot:scaffold271469_cov30-Tisochrysis_lutea.AAC.1